MLLYYIVYIIFSYCYHIYIYIYAYIYICICIDITLIIDTLLKLETSGGRVSLCGHYCCSRLN